MGSAWVWRDLGLQTNRWWDRRVPESHRTGSQDPCSQDPRRVSFPALGSEARGSLHSAWPPLAPSSNKGTSHTRAASAGITLSPAHGRNDPRSPLDWVSAAIPGGGGGLVAQSCPTLATPWTVAHQAPLSRGFSRQEYWSGLPFPSPGDLPNPQIKLRPPLLQAGSVLTELHKNGSK